MPESRQISRHSTRLALVLALCVVGCGKSRGDAARPEATLSGSAGAQAAFRVLRAAWFSGSSEERRKLEPELRGFLVRFPDDEASDMVRVLIAFDLVSRGALAEAAPVLAAVRERVGAVRDFSQVARAYALLRTGNPDAAWDLLEPLAGKIVDPDERLVFGELRLRAAAEAHRYTRATRAAEALLTDASADGRAALEDNIRALFQNAPKAELVLSLASVSDESSDDAASAARDWLRKALRERLVALAVADKDAKLARDLLDSAPAALRASPSGAKLVGIASGGQTAPLILGRSLGLVLSLGDAEARRRSASVAAGLSRGLGLPEAANKPGGVHLISEEDGGTRAGTEAALRELAAEGAAIIVAGVDASSAETARAFAEENSIAIMLVEVPGNAGARHSAFVLGETREREQALIDAELSRRNWQRIARVGEGFESCDAPPSSAGRTRFPVDEWRQQGVSCVLVLGSAACASDVARDLRASHATTALALGLAASEFVYANEAGHVDFGVGAGSFPSASRPDAPADSALPPLDWYEALGHDAALLAKGALGDFPEGRVDDLRTVRELHARAKHALEVARAPLWTSDSQGFSADRVLPRTLAIISAKLAPKAPQKAPP